MKTTKPVAPVIRRRRLERQAIGLSKRCPVDRSNPGSCPLCDLRLLGIRQRTKWVHGLTLGELKYLLSYHVCCAAEKKREISGQRKRRARPAKG
ncbi:MAG: hypothetical protein EXS32_03135 [Opitutus sp.]|nr:hypothetical protein [Opitutus sp.]